MFSLGDELRSRQLTLRLVIAPGSPIERMLKITGLDRVYPTYATVGGRGQRVVGGRAADDGLERLDEVRLVEVAEVERQRRASRSRRRPSARRPRAGGCARAPTSA